MFAAADEVIYFLILQDGCKEITISRMGIWLVLVGELQHQNLSTNYYLDNEDYLIGKFFNGSFVKFSPTSNK